MPIETKSKCLDRELETHYVYKWMAPMVETNGKRIKCMKFEFHGWKSKDDFRIVTKNGDSYFYNRKDKTNSDQILVIKDAIYRKDFFDPHFVFVAGDIAHTDL